MSERFQLEGNEIKDNGFFLSGKVQYTEVMNRLNDDIDQLKQQLADAEDHIDALEIQLREQYQLVDEKDKEIAHLKDFIGCKGCLDVIKKSNENQTQLAIQELEKVKEWLEPKYFDYEQINYLTRIIDQQINYLRGEKDVED